eukprot:Skav225778  [mRNA]  locus=scaffold1577:173643:174806:+ [translate_table: standard]
MKRAGKTGFQWSCLFLAIYTLISDVRRVLALLSWHHTQDVEATQNTTESIWQTAASNYFCVMTIWTGSSNAATGFAMNSLGVMFQTAVRFPGAHCRSPEEIQIYIANINTVLGLEIWTQKGFSTSALFMLTHKLYFLPIVWGSAPLLLLGELTFSWIFVPAHLLSHLFAVLFYRIVTWVKARNRRDQVARSSTHQVEPSESASDDSEQETGCFLVPEFVTETDTESEDDDQGNASLVAEPVLPFEPVESLEAVRRVYEIVYAGPGSVLTRKELAAASDEAVMATYQCDVETFRVLGTTSFAVMEFAICPFLSITIFLWAPLLVGRFATAMIWESQGFWAAYWDAAVVRTFGERHWWLYRDYLIKTCNTATWGGCESLYLGLLNRIWP